MSVALDSSVLQTVGVEPPAALDDQGKPSYGASVNIQARVVREDVVVRMANGEQVKTVATMWIPGSQSPMPSTDARLTCVDGLVGIVVERVEGRSLQNDLDHVRVRIREV